jgi:hypothetical protein
MMRVESGGILLVGGVCLKISKRETGSAISNASFLSRSAALQARRTFLRPLLISSYIDVEVFAEAAWSKHAMGKRKRIRFIMVVMYVMKKCLWYRYVSLEGAGIFHIIKKKSFQHWHSL